jgi:4-oxalocrotonate tautomerase
VVVPIAQILILEGRTPEQRREMMRSVTLAIAQALGANPETVRVIIQEVPAESWGVGGIPVQERGR